MIMVILYESPGSPGQVGPIPITSRVGPWTQEGIKVEGHEALVALLLARYDIEANLKDPHGQSPLSLAAKNGHEGIVRLLVVRNDIHLNSKTSDGRSPLSFAAEKGREAVVRLLIACDGVDVNSKDKHGRTPLSFADGGGYEAIVKIAIPLTGLLFFERRIFLHALFYLNSSHLTSPISLFKAPQLASAQTSPFLSHSISP